MKKLFCLLMILVVCMSLSIAAFATDDGVVVTAPVSVEVVSNEELERLLPEDVWGMINSSGSGNTTRAHDPPTAEWNLTTQGARTFHADVQLFYPQYSAYYHTGHDGKIELCCDETETPAGDVVHYSVKIYRKGIINTVISTYDLLGGVKTTIHGIDCDPDDKVFFKISSPSYDIHLSGESYIAKG